MASEQSGESGARASGNQSKKEVITFSHLVSVRLDETNFLIWKHQILSAIRGYNLYDFIDRSVKPPAKYTPDPKDPEPASLNPDYKDWERQDQLLASWISCSMTDPMLTRVVGCTTSLQIWERIQSHFASQTRARVRQLKNQLKNVEKGSLSANDYLLKIKAITDALAGIGHPIDESDHIELIFDGLGDTYDPWITAITTRSEPYTLDQIESLLLSQEARSEKNHKPASVAMANFAQSKSSGRGETRSRGGGR